MSYAEFIKSIEAEWEPSQGFLWKVRQGQFDQPGFERLRAKLEALTIDESAQLPRRLVAVLWYMPLFMNWQMERVREFGCDDKSYAQAVASVTNEVERLLGTP